MRKTIIRILFLFLLFTMSYELRAKSSFADDIAVLEFNLDVNSPTIALPKIFKPCIDLSGRGSYKDITWPQSLAAKNALDSWKKDIGLSGLFRLQYNLWEINQLAKSKDDQGKILDNYDSVIKDISDSGGTVILDLFGTPAGLGKVLDKKSPPWDLRAFKALVKNIMRNYSCDKKYNVWYEVWNAPDMDDFFLGRKQDYLNLYRAVAESARELENETKVHIPVGGPSVSWWLQSLEGNTVASPERSLVYELIKFCYSRHLPIDFISWHSYSTDPTVENESTIYKRKSEINLIKDWLGYFGFYRDTPLVVDEWNYDRDSNMAVERGERGFIGASYIPARIKNMYEAKINYQIYFCLEDFLGNKEGVSRNVGLTSFDPEHPGNPESYKATYNVMRFLSMLGGEMFPSGIKDDFCSLVATKSDDGAVILAYNYIDPDTGKNYLSRNIATFTPSQRKVLVGLIKSDKFSQILAHKLEVKALHVDNRIKAIVSRALELNDTAEKLKTTDRKIKLTLKGLSGKYTYERYAIDADCSIDCPFSPREQKEIIASKEPYSDELLMKPYSVSLIILKKKPEAVAEPASTQN